MTIASTGQTRRRPAACLARVECSCAACLAALIRTHVHRYASIETAVEHVKNGGTNA